MTIVGQTLLLLDIHTLHSSMRSGVMTQRVEPIIPDRKVVTSHIYIGWRHLTPQSCPAAKPHT